MLSIRTKLAFSKTDLAPDRRPSAVKRAQSCSVYTATGFWVMGSGFWVLGSGCWGLGTGFWVLGAGVWVLGSGCWVLGAGVLGAEFLVLGDTSYYPCKFQPQVAFTFLYASAT